MEYQLIRDFDDFFEERVRKAIDEGWEPVGGVAMSQSENDMFGFAYAQAMVRKSKENLTSRPCSGMDKTL